MTNGTYAFILVTMSPVDFLVKIKQPFKWFTSDYPREGDTKAQVKEAFKTALLLGPTIKDTKEVKEFVNKVRTESDRAPFRSKYYLEYPTDLVSFEIIS